MRYDTLLFDADGTLFDFSRCEAEAVRRTMTLFGIQPTDEKVRDYSEINDSLWKKLERKEIEKSVLLYRRFEMFCEKYGYVCDAKEMAREYTLALAEYSYMFDGAMKLCQKLASDFDMYIVTNGVEYTQTKRYANSGIDKYFKGIFISGVIGHEKPSLEYFQCVEQKIPNFDKQRAIIIGDSLSSDIKGGINYGIDTCWYNPHRAAAPSDMDITHIACDFDDIYEFLTRGE